MNEHPAGGSHGEWHVRPREPVFNLPAIITALMAILFVVHLARALWLTPDQNVELYLRMAFIPAIYGPMGASAPMPEAAWWMPFSYSLLHADWMHLGMNLLWMLAFGTPVARRFGAGRFIALTLIASAGGALLHYLSHVNELAPMIGASGAVSGYMGAASRFVFDPAGRMGRAFRHDGPAMPLVASFSNPQFLAFAGVWLVINLVFGLGSAAMPGEEGGIAWQAHVGGFFAGLLAFSLLERSRPQATP